MQTINFIKTQPRPGYNLPIKKILGLIAVWLVLFSASSLFIAYFPILQKEINYRLNRLPKIVINKTELKKISTTPVNTDFSIVIPKISVNSNVASNVDLNNKDKAELILEKNVGHALGSALPGQKGTVYLYGHSAFLNILGSEQNSVFYLLDKLEAGDEIEVFYNDYRYFYQVLEAKVTEASDVSFLLSGKEQLVLQTCWPLGTNLKRFVVIAQPLKNVI